MPVRYGFSIHTTHGSVICARSAWPSRFAVSSRASVVDMALNVCSFGLCSHPIELAR